MKKKLIVLFLIVVSLSCIFGLTACNGSTKYVCEDNEKEYLILTSGMQYQLYRDNDLIEEGSYGFIKFKGADNITFRPYKPDLKGAEITDRANNEEYEELLADVGQVSGTIINDVITVVINVGESEIIKVYKKV